jgi:hypothetical protein
MEFSLVLEKTPNSLALKLRMALVYEPLVAGEYGALVES